MAFDASLDKELFAETANFDATRIKVGVYAYNEGVKKLQLGRENASQEGSWKWSKLGRMTKEETEAVIPLMQKALDYL
ncbi:hypothetical protein COV11_03650 [Candidatus Woesearchaeota archaeon CG10_big_fil_rev_8_21_14_0_10_30_7]|nr:MAG: hypothetical protein COV11_03650 [Candidatus Woesearchaeota archaeon CG10_big_fil_rev_8_21_14_0_10_30_7]